MRLPMVVLLVTLAACADRPAAGRPAAAPPAPEIEYIPVQSSRPLPFSAAVRVGDMIYLSGQIGTDSTGRLVPGGIGPETRQALENIRVEAERAGSSIDRVVKCTAMLADMDEWAAMNEVYVTYFRDRLPARSAFGASGLAMGARIELECWAVADPARRAESAAR